MRVVIQIGYVKTMNRRRIGQSVKAYVNDDECSWSDNNGQYITPMADTKKGILWFLWEGHINNNDSIKLEVKTFILGAGPDESRTFESICSVDKDAPVIEIIMPGVGKKGYPILKGRLIEIGAVSEQDKRESKITEFLDDSTF